MAGGLRRLQAVIAAAALFWLAPWSNGKLWSQPPASAEMSCDTATIAGIVSSDSTVTITSATAVSVPSTSTQYCEVMGAIATSSGGETGSVEFEAGLPLTTWNGQFLFIGGGGFVGTLGSVQAGVAAGFATAVTDAGHESPYGALDGSFGLLADNSPNLAGREDFSYRAVHLSTVTAKTIAQAFYASASLPSYFDGCSIGGRQALVEAQKFPTDYNGIVAGDPTISDPIAGFNWNDEALFAAPSSYLPPNKIQLLDQAVLKQCDGVDGALDGLIQDPRECKFDPATLECSGGDAPSCLTADQVAAVEKIYSGARTPDGQQLYPGYMPSDPGGADGWTAWITSDSSPAPPDSPPDPWGTPPAAFPVAPYQWSFQEQFMRYFVFDNPSYDSLSFNFADPGQVSQLTSIATEFGGNGIDTDLAPFFSNGGKLLMYHGWSDPALTPLVSVDYYSGVAETLHGGFSHLRDNARLFMVPGMHHCGGGPGPNSFDPLTPLIQWVETGKAPDQILAYHFKNNDPADNPVPDRSMPLCPYPQVAVFQGGDVNAAANWKCGAHTNHGSSPGYPGGKK